MFINILSDHSQRKISTRGPWALLCLRINLEGHWPRFPMLHIHSLSIPGGQNQVYFHSMGSGFRDTAWFFKISKFGHETWLLAIKVPEVAHAIFSTPGGRNWAYFCSTHSAFQDMGPLSKLPYLGMKLGHWPKFQRLHIYSLYLRGSKLSLFLLYGQWFPRYGHTFKICIFGHETWQVARVTEVAQYPLSTPWGQNWAYFRSMGSGFWDMGRFSKLPYSGMKLGHCPKFQKFHIYSLSTQGGRNWAYFHSTGSAFWDTGQLSKLPYLGMKLGSSKPKFQKLYIYSLSTPWGQNWAYFRSMGSGFRDTGRFSKLPYLGMKLGSWPKCQKLPIQSLSTTGGRNQAYFHSTGSGFQDTRRFSKPGHWPKCQKLHNRRFFFSNRHVYFQNT